MKILFEECVYDTKDIEKSLGNEVLPGAEEVKGGLKFNYVGYFYTPKVDDLVFVLPKVFLEKGHSAEDYLVFGQKPADLIAFDVDKWKDDEGWLDDDKILRRKDLYRFLFEFSVWLYSAVNQYGRKRPEDLSDGELLSSTAVVKGRKMLAVTYLDIMQSLMDFHREHQSYITFVVRMAHSGHNKISWPRTIAKTQAIIQDGVPIYLNPVNKKKSVNYDEELLIIFYSILNFMHDRYGFSKVNRPGFKLITGAAFQKYLDGLGLVRLRKIRYKYYSDIDVRLWNLCFAFFDRTSNLRSVTSGRDFFLVKKFETVFEGMVDELIGDKDLPKDLKKQRDDKRIDHLYISKYLLENNECGDERYWPQSIYNIADSKYYSRDGSLRGHDIPKQFTYARNVIQWHMDLLNELIAEKQGSDNYKQIPLFDVVTEGFNVIPNFFISAIVNKRLSYDEPDLKYSDLGVSGSKPYNYFFWDRLFDRSTMFTLHYDVNFLFILKKYAQNRAGEKAKWRKTVREEFRKKILEHLNNSYDFYQLLVPSKDIQGFVDANYRKLQGKVFSFVDSQRQRVLLYAERKQPYQEKTDEFTVDDAKDVHVEGSDFVVPGVGYCKAVKMTLGKEKYVELSRCVFLPKVAYSIKSDRLESDNAFGLYPLAELGTWTILVGYYKSKEHLDWIRANKKYNIPAKRRSANVVSNKGELQAKYLILVNDKLGSVGFDIKSNLPYLMKKEEFMSVNSYAPSKDYYLVFDVEEPNVSSMDQSVVLAHQKVKDKVGIGPFTPFSVKPVKKVANDDKKPNLLQIDGHEIVDFVLEETTSVAAEG